MMDRLVIKNQILEDFIFLLDQELILVGRGKECQLHLEAQEVSRFHARLERRPDGTLLVEDLGSSNGTFVNGERVTKARVLVSGDRLRFATVEGLVVLSENLPDSAAAREAPEKLLRFGHFWRLRLGLSLLLVMGWAVWRFVPSFSKPAAPETLAQPRSAPAPQTEGHAGASKEVPPAPSPSRTRPAPPPAKQGARKANQHANPSPRAAKKRWSHLLLRSGKQRELELLQLTEAWLLLRGKEGQTLRLPREEVAQLDGHPLEFHVQRALAERKTRVHTLAEQLALARWCQRQGLKREMVKLARDIIARAPNNRPARGLLQELLYKGAWVVRATLEKTGALTSDGRLVGTNQDRRRLKRQTFALLGHPPLQRELQTSLELKPALLLDRLLAGAESWRYWCRLEAARLLPPEKLAEASAFLKRWGGRLAQKDGDIRDFFAALIASPLFSRSASSPVLLMQRLFATLLDLHPSQGDRALGMAVRMYQGNQVPLFGDRGQGPLALMTIMARQPAFYKSRMELLSRQLLGREPDPEESTGWLLKLATRPQSWRELRRRWAHQGLLSDTFKQNRLKSPLQFVRSLYADLLARPPAPPEEAWALEWLALPGPPDLIRTLLPPLLLSRESLAGAPPAETQREEWVLSLFKRLYTRSPRQKELQEALKLLARPGGQKVLAESLLQSEEYQRY